jgi:hypothetical protein
MFNVTKENVMSNFEIVETWLVIVFLTLTLAWGAYQAPQFFIDATTVEKAIGGAQ